MENCIDAWIAIQDWKKTLSTNHNFQRKAFKVVDNFVREEGERHTGLDFPGKALLLDTFKVLKNSTHTGFYKEESQQKGVLRSVLGMSAPTYVRWTEEGVLCPTVLDEFEWHCFFALYNAVNAHRQKVADSEHFQEWMETYSMEHDEKERAVAAKFKVFICMYVSAGKETERSGNL